MPLHAVLTGDIVNSTKLDTASEGKLVERLRQTMGPYKSEFFRGDSFQAYLPDCREALQIALVCRTAAIGLNPEATTVISDVRISIGIGKVDHPVHTLASAKGEAFILSGRGLDDLERTEGRLVITLENHPMASLTFKLMTDYVNSIYRQMTAKQAEVIMELLNGESQQQVADKLNRSKSTISQHVTAGRWDEIENILNNYKSLIELLT